MVSEQFKGMFLFIHNTYVFQILTDFHNSRLKFTSCLFEVAPIALNTIMQTAHLHLFHTRVNTSNNGFILNNTSNNALTPRRVFEPILPPMNPSLHLPPLTHVPTTNINGHLSVKRTFEQQVCELCLHVRPLYHISITHISTHVFDRRDMKEGTQIRVLVRNNSVMAILEMMPMPIRSLQHQKCYLEKQLRR